MTIEEIKAEAREYLSREMTDDEAQAVLEKLTGKPNDDASKEVSGGGAECSLSIDQVKKITQERFGRKITDQHARIMLDTIAGRII